MVAGITSEPRPGSNRNDDRDDLGIRTESTTYADAWGYRDAMGDLWVRYRGDPAEAV